MEAESGQSATTRATWLLPSSDEEEGGGEEEVRLVSATLFPVDWRHRVRRNLAALEEYCLCVIIPALLCMFAASALTADWYSTQILTLSPNISLLIEPSPWLVYAIEIQVFHGQAGPMLYGFISAPPLRSKATWDEVHDIIVGPHHVEASTMWLNKGSFLNVTCSIKRPGAANVVLKILEEQKSAQSWIQDFNQESELQCFQTNFNHPVAGGQLHYVVPRDGNYSVLVDNLEKQTVEVLLVLQIYATLYSTDAAVYLCIPYPKACSLHLSMFGKRAALLSTPNEYQNSSWEATLSYRIRWFSIATALGIWPSFCGLLFRIFISSAFLCTMLLLGYTLWKNIKESDSL